MSIGVLFSGQGAQRVGMGRSIYSNSALARTRWDEARSVLGWDIQKICFEGPEGSLTETRICQPALYVHGFALFQILQASVGDVQVAMGLSLGELTALAAAGVFDFATGLQIVAERGRLMQEACERTRGGMTSLIGGSREIVEALCQEFSVEIANLNCPGQIVVSGELERVQALTEKAKTMGFKMVVPLKVAGAYHSSLMKTASDAFAAFLSKITFRKPRFAVYTNTTAEVVQEPESIKTALVRQIVAPVQWEACVRKARLDGLSDAYECGPGAVLAGLIKRIDKDLRVVSLNEAEDLSAIESKSVSV